MADFRDVINARTTADAALAGVPQAATLNLRDGELATMMAARAICLELRALGLTLDYLSRDARRKRV